MKRLPWSLQTRNKPGFSPRRMPSPPPKKETEIDSAKIANTEAGASSHMDGNVVNQGLGTIGDGNLSVSAAFRGSEQRKANIMLKSKSATRRRV